METNNPDARAANRFLSEHVANDFVYPDSRTPFAVQEVHSGDLNWREREYGTSDSSGAEERKRKKSESSIFRFSSPDAVGEELKARRKRRRQRKDIRVKKEAEWNKGLAIFVARRDAWTGAKNGANIAGQPTLEDSDTAPSAGSEDSKPISSDTDKSNTSMNTEQQALKDEEPPLVPQIPLILASNPLRQTITKATYPEIYNKVVSLNRTPHVPINLADMTRAIVKGWQDSDEWPPKIGPLEPLAGRRRVANTARRSSGKGSADAFREDSSSQFLANHPHVKRGVESMRRVFRLSGSQSSTQAGTDQTPG